MFGRLTLDALRHDWIEYSAGAGMILAGIAAVAWLFYHHRWQWLWKEWLTTLDPKRIGVMYILVATVMLLKGFFDALMMRGQQAFSVGDMHGYLGSDHFQQVFTAHGTTMIFFVAMGVIFGMMNWIVPLQIGARDVAFPFVNALSFWLFATGGMLLMVSLLIGEFSATGWVAYPPLSGIKYSPGVGMDYWIWSVQIAGAGSLMGGINFLVTILKMRCPGMTLMKMPLFTWTILATTILIIFAFPILTVTLALLALDRLMDMRFFTADFGGNPMLYVNLIWAWGHPEVYILILPAFGVFSEVVSTYCQKRLFGYAGMVWAIGAITVLSFIVWLHHFFTMGASANVNAFFGIMTMLIAIPTGVKIFNWQFTMFRGRIQFKTPMMWFLGFVVTFTVGGMAGVLLSIAPFDFQVHPSLFLIAHFHSVIIGGVLFGFFAGFTYWFPKVTGFKLNERLGHYAFWCWFIGFLMAFLPLYVLGLMGATRRLDHYDAATGWQPLFIVAGIGALIIAVGIGFQLLQVFVSIKERKQNRDLTGNPWHGGTLEWSTPSPPPVYNFPVIPVVDSRDPLWTFEDRHTPPAKIQYEDLAVPKNSPVPVLLGGCAFTVGFAIIWYLWWLVALGAIAFVALLIWRLSDDDPDYWLTAAEVERIQLTALHGGVRT